MCDCDLPDAFCETQRRARVEHQCIECGETIRSGDRYQYVSGVWDGRGASFKSCMRCVGVREFYVKECLPRDECWPCFGELFQDATDGDYTRETLIADAAAAGYGVELEAGR